MNMLSNVLDLNDKMTKMTMLLGVSALLVLMVKNNEKALTSNLSNSLLLLIILGTLFFAQQINNEEEKVNNTNVNDIDNSSISDLSQGTVTENFQDGVTTEAASDLASDLASETASLPASEAASEAASLPESEVVSEVPSEVASEVASEVNSEVNSLPPSEVVSEPELETNSLENSVSGISSYSDNDNNFATFGSSDVVPPNVPESCFPKDIRDPSELLPKDKDGTWAQNTPSGQGGLGDKNFLNAGHHIGVNTIGQSLRNANRQLRSDPPNPQVKVSPWLQSTIEPDINRRALEIS